VVHSGEEAAAAAAAAAAAFTPWVQIILNESSILLCTKTKICKKEEKGGPFWRRLYSTELGVGRRRV
jgi:hypothetical protein